MEPLLVERDHGIVRLTLNRPQVRNALNSEMMESLVATLREVESRASDRVVMVAGAAGAFCSGADLGEARTDPDRLARIGAVNDVASALHRLSKPTIAKVDGASVGGGCSLALGCDLIVASERSSFSLIFARRGLSLDMGSSWLLPRLVGLHRARELAFFGDRVSASEAAAMGLINRVVPAEDLDATADDWALRLATGARGALRDNKLLLNASLGHTWDQALDVEAGCQAVNLLSVDADEARRAFREKRAPRFL